MRVAAAVVFGLLFVLGPARICHAQEQLTRGEQRAIIDKTLEHIRANYVFPDRAKAIEVSIRENVQAGRYDAVTQLAAFLEALNHDMQTAGNDQHLRLIHNPRVAGQLKAEAAGAPDVSPEFLAMLRDTNYRLRKAESLEGNVGYFKFDNFIDPKYAGEALIGAMNMLHASAALILDLSDNGGGSSETVDLLLSYFLPEGTRVSESWNRVTNETRVSRVTRLPAVKPLLDIPIYILVSNRTASAAEAVAYALQQAKRGVVIGTHTKGMANAGQHFLVSDALFVMVPTIVSRNAVSGTNWEGVGVVPDVAVRPGTQLEAAMAHALNVLADREASMADKQRLRFMAQGYAALASREDIPAGPAEAYLGRYRGGQDQVQVVRQDGLWFISGESRRRMTYLGDQTFAIEGRSDYRIRFQVDQGLAVRLEVIWFDGTSDVFLRSGQPHSEF